MLPKTVVFKNGVIDSTYYYMLTKPNLGGGDHIKIKF